jgi:hypothetical protein
MKYIPAAALAALLLGLPLALDAQQPHDFSGTWTIDLARSQSAQQGEAIKPVTFVITQIPTQVRIETTRGNARENVLYPLTKTRANTSAGSNGGGQAEAYWDGDRLVTETQRLISGQTVTVREAHLLGPGPADMTVETMVIVQHGYSMPGAKNYGTSTDIYTRQTP